MSEVIEEGIRKLAHDEIYKHIAVVAVTPEERRRVHELIERRVIEPCKTHIEKMDAEEALKCMMKGLVKAKEEPFLREMSVKKIEKMLRERGYSEKAIKEILEFYGLGES